VDRYVSTNLGIRDNGQLTVLLKKNTFTIDITTTDPIWFYCAQAMHCQAGMVGVINV